VIVPLLAFGVPLVLALAGTAVLIPLSPRLGLLDMPAARKVHTTPTPKGGGIAIVLAVGLTLAGLILTHQLPLAALTPFGIAAAVALLGLADDLRPLPWQFRLIIQFGLATAAVLLVLPEMDWLRRALAIFWIAGMINAFNMLDNMDALSPGVAWIATGWLVLLLGESHALPLLPLMGALSGFLVFNRPPARIFMGDVGSMYLGATIGIATVQLGQSSDTAWGWTAPLFVCAVPCYDMTTVVLLRLKQGKSPFHPDKQHLSHRLVERGLSKPAAVGVIWLLGLVSGFGAFVLYGETWTGAAIAVGWAIIAVIELSTRPGLKEPRTE
jgi:UDP-GlcNAc:undecaprenyl-phosphate GlcNAc-1-phosphate transferase